MAYNCTMTVMTHTGAVVSHCISYRPFQLWKSRFMEFSLCVNFRSLKLSFSGTCGPWNFYCLELSFLGANRAKSDSSVSAYKTVAPTELLLSNKS